MRTTRKKGVTRKWQRNGRSCLRIHSTNILAEEALRSWKRTGGGLWKPPVVTWVTRSTDASGRVSPVLPPFLAVIKR